MYSREYGVGTLTFDERVLGNGVHAHKLYQMLRLSHHITWLLYDGSFLQTYSVKEFLFHNCVLFTVAQLKR